MSQTIIQFWQPREHIRESEPSTEQWQWQCFDPILGMTLTFRFQDSVLCLHFLLGASNNFVTLVAAPPRPVMCQLAKRGFMCVYSRSLIIILLSPRHPAHLLVWWSPARGRHSNAVCVWMWSLIHVSSPLVTFIKLPDRILSWDESRVGCRYPRSRVYVTSQTSVRHVCVWLAALIPVTEMKKERNMDTALMA